MFTNCLRLTGEDVQDGRFFFLFVFLPHSFPTDSEPLDASLIFLCASFCEHFWITQTTCDINLRQMLVLCSSVWAQIGAVSNGLNGMKT